MRDARADRIDAVPESAVAFSWQRVSALMLRHLYILRRSWPRVLDLAYWPTVQMLLWGFITVFFQQHSSWVAEAAGVLISAVLLWDVLFRANLGLSLSFLEEMWARNLGQLFVSPMRPAELVTAMSLLSLIRTLISVTPAAVLALPLFDVWVFSLGPPLVAFFANLLVLGWTVGLIVSALVLRLGLGAENLAWVAIFAIAPLSGIYYPIETLPVWLQPVSWALPSAYVFEGMRAVLFEGTFRWDLLAGAVALNAVYFAAAVTFFLRMIHVARERGLLLQQGE
ncbi:MAG: ABC transporter permease [Rhodospirillales bacterium]|nr:MAG: ABC transporter permease [Rhodospirillales bacterium]